MKIDRRDFEKWTLGITFGISVITACVLAIISPTHTLDAGFSMFSLGIGTLFVARKKFSYDKPSTYDSNVSTQIIPETSEESGGNI